MKNPHLRSAALAMLAALAPLAASTPAHATQTVLWPSFAATPTGSPAPALVGAPDLAYRLEPANVGKFDRRVDYATMAATMGLSEAEFARYDLVAWEGNGGSPGSSGGWESARFVFDDLHTAVAARYDEVSNTSDNPAVQFLTGSISGSAYDGLFGTHGATPVMSWLLIDLPDTIAVHAPSFLLRFEGGGLSAGGLGEGTPDMDAIGVIASVPEPASQALALLGLAALAAGVRQRAQPAA